MINGLSSIYNDDLTLIQLKFVDVLFMKQQVNIAICHLHHYLKN